MVVRTGIRYSTGGGRKTVNGEKLLVLFSYMLEKHAESRVVFARKNSIKCFTGRDVISPEGVGFLIASWCRYFRLNAHFGPYSFERGMQMNIDSSSTV